MGIDWLPTFASKVISSNLSENKIDGKNIWENSNKEDQKKDPHEALVFLLSQKQSYMELGIRRL